MYILKLFVNESDTTYTKILIVPETKAKDILSNFIRNHGKFVKDGNSIKFQDGSSLRVSKA